MIHTLWRTVWQREIDNGNDLPDLYIVHIAIGAEGITYKNLPDGKTRKYMWNPNTPETNWWNAREILKNFQN